MVVIPLECSQNTKKMIHLIPNTKVGDWFICEGHTIIRIYGVEVQPYLLAIYLRIRLFALEYIQKILNFISFIVFIDAKRLPLPYMLKCFIL